MVQGVLGRVMRVDGGKRCVDVRLSSRKVLKRELICVKKNIVYLRDLLIGSKNHSFHGTNRH